MPNPVSVLRSPLAFSCEVSPRLRAILLGVPLLLLSLAGCSDDTEKVRTIQAQRQLQMQSESQEDHLGEAFDLISRLVELNDQKARRQITYHLNRWVESRPLQNVTATKMLGTVRDLLPDDEAAERTGRTTFHPSDVDHLRDSYLFRQIVEWVDQPQRDDPLLAEWLTAKEAELDDESAAKLRTATRLFDWTVRNIAFEPLQLEEATPPPPPLPFNLQLHGAGYRQSNYKTVWRGIGDSLQRSGVFIQLCRQASIPAFVLATQSTETGKLDPWCVGVLIGEEVYLFEPELSIHIPGPDQVGIATLAQARKDPSVLRRLNVPGFFDYRLSSDDIQQCLALLNIMPEGVSARMQLLESGLTGARRMVLFTDVDALANRLDQVAGIAEVRFWEMPLLAEIYEEELKKASERDPLIAFWYLSRWAILDAPIGMSQQLALGRWRHLHGQFDDHDEENFQGARTLYLAQRPPEFEIKDLNIDVDLQQAYGVRRDLGVDTETFNRQVAQVQALMRGGKRTATYWISLIQYEDAHYDTAENWFTKRVLNESQLSIWEAAARYNLARSLERLGKIDQAIEIYKTDGDPQEHGNRIRARLLTPRTSASP
jgi:tetratricopeptide (TPR) repeat protein